MAQVTCSLFLLFYDLELICIRRVKEELLVHEIQELKLEKHGAEMCENNSWPLLRVIKDKSLRLPLLLVCCLQAGQQFSGINAVCILYFFCIYKL